MKPNPLSADNAPNNAKQLVTEAESLFSVGNVSASEQLCRRALKKDKLNADAIGLLALVSYQADNIVQAKPLLSQAIKIKPKNAVLHYRLAIFTRTNEILTRRFLVTARLYANHQISLQLS